MQNNIPNLHLLEVKYIGASNHKGSCTKITSQRFKDSVTLNYSHEYNSSLDQAIAYLERIGYTILGKGETINGYFVIVQEFTNIKEQVGIGKVGK